MKRGSFITAEMAMAMSMAFLGCSTGFEISKNNLSALKRIGLTESAGFVSVPRIGFSNQGATVVEGTCEHLGAVVRYRVPGTLLAGTTLCFSGRVTDSKIWKATVDFSQIPDGSVLVLAEELLGTSRIQLGIIEYRKDSDFCAVHSRDSVPYGAGDSHRPYQICSAEQFAWLALEDNVPRGDESLRIILRDHLYFAGESLNSIEFFAGKFVGGGFSINSRSGSQGLFGRNFSGSINEADENMWMPYVDADSYALILRNNTVRTTADVPVGSLIGSMVGGTVYRVLGEDISVSGVARVGGLFGEVSPLTSAIATVSKCQVMFSSVAGASSHVGGFIGKIGSRAKISRTFMRSVGASAPTVVGGMVGANAGQIVQSLLLDIGAFNGMYLNPALPPTPAIAIQDYGGGVVGINESPGILSRTTAVTLVLPHETGLGANVGGMIGSNDGSLAGGILLTTVFGAVNSGGVVGINRGNISDIAAIKASLRAAYSYSLTGNRSVGGFVGNASTGSSITRSYVAANMIYVADAGVTNSELPTGLIQAGFVGYVAPGGGLQGGNAPLFNGAFAVQFPYTGEAGGVSMAQATSPQPVVTGSGGASTSVVGIATLNAALSEPFQSDSYVFRSPTLQTLSWGDPSVVATSGLCGQAEAPEQIWTFVPSTQSTLLPAPNITDRCP